MAVDRRRRPRYQQGRVFLAGDAAHVMPPNGGFGGNTGIHDAHNLAWKIAMVLQGHGDPALLGTYDAERRPVGRFTVEQAYTRYVRRTAPYLGVDDAPPLAPDLHIELGYLYRSGAVVADGDDLPEGHDDPRETRARPGSRLPHAWVERDGQKVSTIDLVGSAFAVLTGSGGAAWARCRRRGGDRPPRSPVRRPRHRRRGASKHAGSRTPARCSSAPTGSSPGGRPAVCPTPSAALRDALAGRPDGVGLTSKNSSRHR